MALSGTVQVQLNVNGVKSNAFSVRAQAQSLSFFEFVSPGGLHYVDGRHSTDNSLVGPASLFPGLTTPVKPGEIISVAANGFGPTDTPVVSGVLVQSGTVPGPLPVVKIGGIPAAVTAPALIAVGTYQINITVPSNVPDGDLDLTAMYDGQSIQANLLITIQR